MNIYFIVTVLYERQIVDWAMETDHESPCYGEEYPVYEDIPFYNVVAIRDYGLSVVNCLNGFDYMSDKVREDVCEYNYARSIDELYEIVPKHIADQVVMTP